MKNFSEYYNEQSQRERRFHGTVGLKIFVPRTDDKNKDYEAASNMMDQILQAIHRTGLTDASYEGLEEISRF